MDERKTSVKLLAKHFQIPKETHQDGHLHQNHSYSEISQLENGKGLTKTEVGAVLKTSDEQDITHTISRLPYLIKKLKSTEVKYGEDLEKIVRTYIPYLEKHTPPHLANSHVERIGYISRICENQKKFLRSVLNCEENVDLIAMAFIEHEYLFDLYSLYLQNKPKADMVLKEVQLTLEQKEEYGRQCLELSAYLLLPLQRLGKYILFIESMEEELKILQQDCVYTQKALSMLRRIMSRWNDCLAIEPIQNSPLRMVYYGSFVTRDKFTITKPSRLESVVFLFTRVVVFTVEDQQCPDIFTYYNSIKMDELTIANFDDGSIHLIDFTKTKRDNFSTHEHTFVLETNIDKVRNFWRKTIEQLLWQQLVNDKDITNNVNVRREVFCDNQGNIRIERIGYPEKNNEDNSCEWTNKLLNRNNSISPKNKLLLIIDELETTEIKYVQDLEKVVKTYIPYLEKHSPPHLDNSHVKLVGNISKIYQNQKRFLRSVSNCEKNVDLIAMAFVEHENLFDLYPVYLQNKPKSEMIMKKFRPIVKQMQEHYEERLDFSAYLITPLQRLGKYILFLERMEKELNILQQTCEHTQKALNMIKSIMSRGNDCVAIESIQKSPLRSIDYGSLIMCDMFTIIKPTKLESMVFLFAKVVVFTVEDQQSNELFTYYESIKMEDLRIATFENGTIHLIDFTHTKKDHVNPQKRTFVLETKIHQITNTWKETIEQMLWQQLDKHRANSLNFQQLQRQSNT